MNEHKLKDSCSEKDLRTHLIQLVSRNYVDEIGLPDAEKLKNVTDELKILNPDLPKYQDKLKDKLNGVMKEERKNLIDRDTHIIFINDTINKFNIDEIAKLTISKQQSYSPPAIWAIFDDIPKFLKENKIFNDEKQEEIKKEDIPMHLYELYVSKRLKNDDDKLDDENEKEVKRVLLDLLNLLKNTNILTAEKNIQKEESMLDDDELMVLEPSLRIKNDLIHVIREYLRLKHEVPYTLDELLHDFDITSDPKTQLQLIRDQTSDYTFPEDVLTELDKRESKKEISDIQTQIKKFTKKSSPQNFKKDS